jgi:uncharacterized membrane protein
VSLSFTVLVTCLYPAAIWLGQAHLEPRLLAGLPLIAALTRVQTFKTSAVTRWWIGGTLLLTVLALWGNALLPLKLYPVWVNAALLGTFTYSLFAPPSMVERIARTWEPDLPAAAISYTRRVTQAWCIFFALNGAIALATSLWASSAVWSLYNGFIAYALMGLLFAGEYCIRRRFKRRHSGSSH